jgi:hydrocephalus-inducing protein
VKLNELVTFDGNSEGQFEIEYRPLLANNAPIEHLLTIRSQELGTFKYKLQVTALEPSLRQTLRFEVPLGSLQSETFTFRSFHIAKCDYTCAVQKPDFFTVAKTVTAEALAPAVAWAGDEVSIPISYEPTEIGEVRDVLVAKSAEGGEFVCELLAVCVPPMPQGPYNIAHGKSFDIGFRNCFSTTCDWNFTVDSPSFRVAAPTAKVNAKTSGNITVFFEPLAEAASAPNGIVSAKLFVTCASIPNIPPWVFYVRGKVDKELPLTDPGSPAKGGKKK